MDSIPPMPPLPPQILSAGDEKLLKNARHASRNLAILATLATLAGVGFTIAIILSKNNSAFQITFAATFILLAAGYWVLAVAARRGNPKAVGVVIVVMAIQICLALIFSVVTVAQGKASFKSPTGGVVLPILVLIALGSSYQTLLELKKRQLWDRVFGSAKPSGKLCLIGGTLVAAGFIVLQSSALFVAHQADREFQQAKAFVKMVHGSEKELCAALQVVHARPGQSEVEEAFAKLTAVEENFEQVRKGTANDYVGDDRLGPILTKYGSALQQWRNGLLILKESDADLERAEKMFALGDRFREEAGDEFDRKFVEK